MLKMEPVHVIRHKYYNEKLSIRRIAKEMDVDRKTVRKYLRRSEPGRDVCVARARPTMAVVGPQIEAVLGEWAGRLEGKHRLTSTRLYRHLHETGVQVGERTVRRYLEEKRRRAAEVYIPLVHRPGDEAQVDFFEVLVDIAGFRRKVWKFLMRLMYSGRDFVRLYERCDQVSFLDGHVRAFEYWEGVPCRGVYDNLSSAVKRRVGLNKRELTDRFLAISSHYIFEPCFARPGEGHDKGGVEGRGKTIRLQHLTPILAGKSLGELSERTMGELERQWAGKVLKDGRRCVDLFQEDRARLRSLPPVPFEARAPHSASVSNSSTVTVTGALYSVPEQWARLDVMAYVGPDDIRFVCRGETVVRERSLSGHKQIRYRDYLGALSRKPQAVRQVAPELVGELGEPYGPLWALLVQTHGERQGARHLAGILGAIREHGEERVTAALAEAQAEGRCNLLALRRFIPAAEELAEAKVPEGLRSIHIEAAHASDYDMLLMNGGVL